MSHMSDIQQTDPDIYNAILWEQNRQIDGMELIASENYQSASVLAAQSSHFANKYAEGFPGKRYYWGQEYTDIIESIAIQRAKSIFRSDHANVQALSGAAANVCAYAALMDPGDTILGMDLSHGGHLTHGAPVTFLSKIFNFVRYKTTAEGKIDYTELRRVALETKPKVVLAGFSAYPRELDYTKFAEIAQEVGAVAYADMAHIGWFIAANVLKNPLDYGFNALMTTTHKSLRWPRWALLLSKWIVGNPLKKPENTIENIPTRIDRAVFPGVQWGPHMNTISAIAVALKEASTLEYQTYTKQVLKNAQIMAEELLSRDYQLVTWGTDNHMVVVDFTEKWYTGRIAERVLDKVGISTSKSTIPDDPNPPFKPSGLRIGIQAMTTRGITQDDTRKIVDFMDRALQNRKDDEVLAKIKQEVKIFCEEFPVPGI